MTIDAMTPPVDLVVIGGGLVGLATARAFLEASPDARVVVIEKEPELALHQSGRNSGVVHAGVYYPAGSLKAELCRQGREQLLRFADEHSIPYQVCGKLVVAVTERELERLDELHHRSRLNGLVGLRMLDAGEMREIEPDVAGIRALHVPETAVIDFRLVTQALAGDIESRGGTIALGHEVISIDPHGGAHRVVSTSAGAEYLARRVVACAGLQSDRVAMLSGQSSSENRIAPFRGAFYKLSPRACKLVRGLIYPVPDPAFPFLGVHFTRRVDGEVWAGPNAVPSLARERYRRLAIQPRDARDLLAFPGFWRLARRHYRTGLGEIWRDNNKRAALADMRRYLPAITAADLTRGPAGIRAQVLSRDGRLVDDFLLERVLGESAPVVHVRNAPSPAATASLAIGQRIAGELGEL